MAESKTTPMLCFTIYSYKKAGLSDETYREYMLKVHAPLASKLMDKYGIVGFNMTHMNNDTRSLLGQLVGSHAEALAVDYDVVSQMMFPTMDCLTNMMADPWFKENVQPDDGKFADMSRTKMSVGWVETIVQNGKIVQKQPQGQEETASLRASMNGSAIPAASG